MSKTLILPAALAALSLSACGDDNIERAVVGAAIGCAAGEVLVDGRCVEGAVVGAGVGVLTN
ncbi:MAG: hypothetical protein AAF822_07495 [Pseudomonadota bacterium]